MLPGLFEPARCCHCAEKRLFEPARLPVRSKKVVWACPVLPVRSKKAVWACPVLPVRSRKAVWACPVLPVRSKKSCLGLPVLPVRSKKAVWDSAQAVSEQEQIVGGTCGVICIARLFLLAGMNEFVLENYSIVTQCRWDWQHCCFCPPYLPALVSVRCSRHCLGGHVLERFAPSGTHAAPVKAAGSLHGIGSHLPNLPPARPRGCAGTHCDRGRAGGRFGLLPLTPITPHHTTQFVCIA